MADWLKIRNEYINGNISYRKLAEKHGVVFQTLRTRAIKEKWFSKRTEQRNKIVTKLEQKTAEKIAEKEANRITRIENAADKLLEKIEIATEQLDLFIVTNKAKQKEVKCVKNKAGFGKPEKEIIQEIEHKEVIKTDFLDRKGLKELTSALKDLKDIQLANNEETPQEDTTVEIIFEAVTPDDIGNDNNAD